MHEFVSRDGDIYLNVPYAEAYIAESLFKEADSQSAIAVEYGEGFKVVGSFNMRFFNSDDEKRSSSPLRTFNYPNMIVTYPSSSVSTKLSLTETQMPEAYRVFQYYMGDIVMSAEEVKAIGNCTKFLNMITRGKIPQTIPYEKFIGIWQNNFEINGFNPEVPSVVLQMIWAELCRDPDDITKPFRYIYGKGGADTTNYISTNMNNVAAATSVFSALSFERIGEKVATSINMTRNKVDQRRSPVEEVLTM